MKQGCIELKYCLNTKIKLFLLSSLKDSYFNTFLRTYWFNSIDEDWDMTAV